MFLPQATQVIEPVFTDDRTSSVGSEIECATKKVGRLGFVSDNMFHDPAGRAEMILHIEENVSVVSHQLGFDPQPFCDTMM
ncbi:hypothetical protein [Neorhodopirellula lusitana]|uniref:hypothetical protein n=1 Tax=Neorhodopirellula lusitana TaxID=445327 RepID=UPI00384C3513